MPEAPKTDATVEAINLLAKALLAQQPNEFGALTKEQQTALRTAPPARKWRIIAGKSPETGATFDMLVIESRTHKEGRVTELSNYRHPAGMYTYESAGGIVPDGMPIFRDKQQPAHLPPGVEPEKNALDVRFLQWRWTEFYQKDLRLVIGSGKRDSGAMRESLCAKPDGIKTPWQDGHTFKHGEAAE